MKITIKEHLRLEGIPSGSALEKINDRHFIFGDDSPYLHILTTNWLPLEALELPDQDAQFYRIPKPTKHDIESAFSTIDGDKAILYALGSGSLSPYRENIFITTYDTQSDWINMEKIEATLFYKKLKDAIPANDSLNIEGAALLNGFLYLAQRGHLQQENYILKMPFQGKSTFDAANSSPCHAVKIELPESLKGYGISGLTIDPVTKLLWCSGSYEKITDTYNDGEIGQSFIGYFDATMMVQKQTMSLSNWSLITLPQDIAPAKIESLIIEKSIDNFVEVQAISDDDKGGTDVFILEVNW